MPPEKPKRRLYSRRRLLRGGLAGLVVIPLPVMLLINHRVGGQQFIDMLLLGLMLCCTIYLVYQGALWLLSIPQQVADDASRGQS